MDFIIIKTDARLYIKQRSQSSFLVKQAQKNSFKMLPSINFVHWTSDHIQCGE